MAGNLGAMLLPLVVVALTWLAMLWTVASAGRLELRQAQASSAGGADSPHSAPRPGPAQGAVAGAPPGPGAR